MNSICPLCDSSKYKSAGRPKTNSISKKLTPVIEKSKENLIKS